MNESHKIHWRLFTNASKKDSASILYKRTISAMGIDASEKNIEPYHKGGFTVTFATYQKGSWESLVLDTLIIAQRFGRSWFLHGSIEDELDCSSNELQIPGVIFAHIQVDRIDT